jgi:hypothetical protein
VVVRPGWSGGHQASVVPHPGVGHVAQVTADRLLALLREGFTLRLDDVDAVGGSSPSRAPG